MPNATFISTLRELRQGSAVDDLDSALKELVAEVKATGKKGEVIIKLKIIPPEKSTVNYLRIQDEITIKKPRRDKNDTIFFPLPDNTLTRTDPNQLPLGLRSVESGPPPAGIKGINVGTGEITQ